jgi:hypothetical protein
MLKDIVAARPLGDYQLFLVFEDGKSEDADFRLIPGEACGNLQRLVEQARAPLSLRRDRFVSRLRRTLISCQKFGHVSRRHPEGGPL